MVLKDKVVVITGGSQGFGKALAQAFKNENANVIVSSHEKENLKSTANELLVDSFTADVTSIEDIKKLGEYIIQKYGRIDIWINNAGIQIAPNLVEEVNIEKLHYLFDVNFFGYFYGCQIALTQIKKQSSGTIININSTAGLDGKPGISAYSSSKFAIKGLTESIRKEVKDLNIQVYGIFPGGMQTDIYKEKYPENVKEYMEVDAVVEKVISNLKLDNPEIDLIIKRPVL
ncbi:MAG: SDR family oxidoreductase [Patescibacteria group bacterium]